MAEKKITLSEIDPVEIFGVNDRLVNRLSYHYPKLKVLPRGNTITLKGTLQDIIRFEKSIDSLIIKRRTKRNLNIDDVDHLFEDGDFGIGSSSLLPQNT